jgi:hypothetical protein
LGKQEIQKIREEKIGERRKWPGIKAISPMIEIFIVVFQVPG